MQKRNIQTEILNTEKKLLDISEKVFAINDIDTMNDWIVKVLNEKNDLAKNFHLPTNPQIKKALLTLIQNSSLLTHPIVNLLSKRISAFIATIGDLYNHPLRGAKLKPFLSNFEPLIKQVKKYNDNFEHSKSIKLISDALKANRLHIYKSSPKEPDLRVALRAFYEDKTRNQSEAIKSILDFVLSQLIKHEKQSGFISQPRHSWWAVLTLFAEADETWLTKNKPQLNKIIRHLINEVEYSPRADTDFASIVPELDSIYNEKTWVTINAIRLFKHEIENYLQPSLVKLLKSKIEQDFVILINEKEDESIKHLQSKLILLYDMLGYLNKIDAIKLSNEKTITLTKNRIGKFLYDDEVITQYKAVFPSIESIIKNRTIWKKHTLSSLLISGSPGQGKSEFASQLTDQIEKLANENKMSFVKHNKIIGTNINSSEELKLCLKEFSEQKGGENQVQVVVFDEFDKADFEFYTPFLPYLETTPTEEQPLTFWIFAQSTFPTFEIFKSYADTLTKKAMKDFSTRLKLGTIDLSELKISPQQKILTAIGYGVNTYPAIREISKQCFLYFATNETLQSSRDLTGVFAKETQVKAEKLMLADSVLNNGKKVDSKENWIKLKL